MKIKFENVEEDFVKNFAKVKGIPSASLEETRRAILRRAFAVTGVGLQDLVGVILASLLEAMNTKLSYEDFYNFLETGLQAKGFLASEMFPAYRWQTIYRTNVKTVFERGRFDRMMTLRDVYPYRRFIAVDDERTTEICRDLNGAVAQWDSELYLNNQTPRHFNCRSTWIIEPNPDIKEIGQWENAKIMPEEGFGSFELPEDFIKELKIENFSIALQKLWRQSKG